jgi:hypothetical protein
VSTLTVPIEQHPTAADRDYGLAIINACMVDFARGIHTADPAELAHEAARLEALPRSPVIRTMRAIVDGELDARRAKAVASC